ncbi:MAG: LLM class flavin-dependent oxidoreductase [Hyphomonas sp.]
MNDITHLRAVFIGSGSLLIACADSWRQRGFSVEGVVSDCPAVTAWCSKSGIDRLAPRQDQAAWLQHKTFEYLFSVVNHAITPAEVLALPLKRAINYHDSPLPRYAGFNATSWAIMDGQSQHAVTWHEMTADVDGGGILLQQPIDIREDDTAFSLGAKCVEAGRQSFQELMRLLEQEAAGTPLATRAQGPQEAFHFRSDRPGLGIVDLHQPAKQIQDFIRALELGSDDNWMCRPKLALPSGLYIVETTTRLPGSGAEPGTVVAVARDGVSFAVADGVLKFSSFTTLEGDTVTPDRLGLEAGQRIPAADDLVSDAAATMDAALTKHERFWVDRLARMRAPGLPDLTPHSGKPDPALEVRKLPAGLGGDAVTRRAALLAALMAYIVRIGEAEAFDIALRAWAPGGAGYASATPLRTDINIDAGFDNLREKVSAELKAQERRAGYARDIVTRYAALRTLRPAAATLPIAAAFRSLDVLTPQDDLLEGSQITLIIPESGDKFAWAYDRAAISGARMRAMADRIDTLLANGLRDGGRAVGDLDLLPDAERGLLLGAWQDTGVSYASDRCVHELFEARVALTPDATAIVFQGAALTYRELNERADATAEALRAKGVGPDDLVAVCIERSLNMMVGLMGVLKAGGAYVPLDPAYPRERLHMMIEDARPKVILTQAHLRDALPVSESSVLLIEEMPARAKAPVPASAVTPDNLAYVIFTSGSTGRPKGVMVRHRNVSNFFTGMDAVIGTEPGVWLAVTSISFDISVLELFWTLTRGFEVVIQNESDQASLSRNRTGGEPKPPMAFSLFYFAAGQGDAQAGSTYKLLLEGARFADTHDFSAVWTPERHFHAFGGPYPNPAVTTAALATITSRVALRAGSVVLPLHNPLRVAEDWSVIDQLSGGRVGLSFASGWHADDFAFMPENYERRREIMLESIDKVMKLWRGEKVEAVNGQGKTISVSVLPRPVQDAPPMWIASAGSVDTFKMAGRIGANVLTNMLGQDLNDLKVKFAAYREARREAGHSGDGIVSVMLHTFVCEDTEKARALAREPFFNYLKSSFDLIKVAPSMFPAFRQPSLDDKDGPQFDAERFTDEDMAALMDHAFDRYFETAGLFGSPEKALGMVDKLRAIGANELACLIDFGVETDAVLESLDHLDRLRQLANPVAQTVEAVEDVQDFSIAAQIRDRGVTHLQCTPSMARMLSADAEGLDSLSGLQRLLLGGEALATDLAERLAPVVAGEIHNMYGPTETTVWSTTSRVRAGEAITIGKPIANTTIRILDPRNQLAPVGVAGELCIGGAGVVRGYLDRPDLTDERFVVDPFSEGDLIYRTGDLARFNEDGVIEFLGRLDHQVKVNGYRIELGEIETVLGRSSHVKQAVVVARTDEDATRLVAYIVPKQGAADVHDETQRIANWESLWDETYRQAANGVEPRFNISGWNDSATGTPIPADEMREWLDHTAQSILALRPKRVLEIGCGTGMVLYNVAPHVEHYTGVDLSPHALETIRGELTADELSRVTLLQQPAHTLSNVAERSCDTVIINSVAQYFPDAAYLKAVLQRASELISDGGQIFIGDVRSRDHLEAFHAGVVLETAPGHLENAELRRRIDQRIAQEGELTLSEAFFHAIVREIPRLSGASVRLKAARARNEMTNFRYDVVLHVGAEVHRSAAAEEVQSESQLMQALKRTPAAVIARDLVNARLAGTYAALAAMSGPQDTTALRAVLEAPVPDAVDPAALCATHPDYDVEILWARSGDPSRFDAVFRHKVDGPKTWVDAGKPEHQAASASYANTPSNGMAPDSSLSAELRAHLREFLPEYMVPSVYVSLDALPLTPNGKIDRKALPAPVQTAPKSTSVYTPPSNAVEQTITDIWKALLGLDRIGRQDNIFDLGANSLLTAQANQRLSAALGRKVSLVSMFRFPTVETLANYLDDSAAPSGLQTKSLQDEGSARKKDAALRRRELRAAQTS